MSLKLIRNAILATTTNPEILIAEDVKAAVKGLPLRESIHPSLEITKSDYDRWMGLVQDVARDSSRTLRKKSELADIAMHILDNDPKIESQPGDKEVLKMHIVDTMWNAYKATVAHSDVTAHVKRAKEEEEQSGFAQDFRTAQGVEDEEQSPVAAAVLAKKDANPYRPGSFRHSLWMQMRSSEENEEFRPTVPNASDDRDADDSSFDAQGKMDDDIDQGEHPDVPPSARDDNDSANDAVDSTDLESEDNDDELDQDPEEVLADISTDDLEAELARRKGDDDQLSDEDSENDEADTDADMDASSENDKAVDQDGDVKPSPAKPIKDKESADDVADRITFDDEQEVKSFFRQALTRPADEMRAAQQEVEKEGQSAWREVKIPKNPHPPKSHAFKAWNKGLITIAKAALGIKDKPVVTSKQKKKR